MFVLFGANFFFLGLTLNERQKSPKVSIGSIEWQKLRHRKIQLFQRFDATINFDLVPQYNHFAVVVVAELF